MTPPLPTLNEAASGPAPVPVDLEQTAADAARSALLAAVARWIVADVLLFARAARLGSPTEIADGGSLGLLADDGEEAGAPRGVRVVRPPNEGPRADMGSVYRGILAADAWREAWAKRTKEERR